MPIYEFVCQDCGHEFEKIQSFSDSSTPACPNCQGHHVQRRLSAPAIHFKGSGWYITDSKQAAKSSATGPTGGSSDADGGKGDGAKSEGDKGSGDKGGADKSGAGKAEGGKSEASGAAPAASPAAKAAE